MSIHYIPEGEENLHTAEDDCICDPIYKGIDQDTGEMKYYHNLLDPESLIDDIMMLLDPGPQPK